MYIIILVLRKNLGPKSIFWTTTDTSIFLSGWGKVINNVVTTCLWVKCFIYSTASFVIPCCYSLYCTLNTGGYYETGCNVSIMSCPPTHGFRPPPWAIPWIRLFSFVSWLRKVGLAQLETLGSSRWNILCWISFHFNWSYNSFHLLILH